MARLHTTVRIAVVAAVSCFAVAGISAKANALPVVQSGGGIIGGGTVASDSGTGEFSVFGSWFEVVGADDDLYVGSFNLSDAGAGIAIVATEITEYEIIPNTNEMGRIMEGTAALNGQGSYPFELTLFDGGAPGEGKDTFDLVVGDEVSAEAPAYSLKGTVSSGDLEIVDLTLPI